MTFLVGIENDILLFVASFVYPSPEAYASTSPSGGEVISTLSAYSPDTNVSTSPARGEV